MIAALQCGSQTRDRSALRKIAITDEKRVPSTARALPTNELRKTMF